VEEMSVTRARWPPTVPLTWCTALAPHASSGSNGTRITALPPGPAATTMGGDAQDVYRPGLDLHREQRSCPSSVLSSRRRSHVVSALRRTRTPPPGNRTTGGPPPHRGRVHAININLRVDSQVSRVPRERRTFQGPRTGNGSRTVGKRPRAPWNQPRPRPPAPPEPDSHDRRMQR
jgi:hypothetical protein